MTKIKTGPDAPLRDCLILDMSEQGVRLYIGGLNIPAQFTLLLGDDAVSECVYEVIWRRDREIGARLVSWPLGTGKGLMGSRFSDFLAV